MGDGLHILYNSSSLKFLYAGSKSAYSMEASCDSSLLVDRDDEESVIDVYWLCKRCASVRWSLLMGSFAVAEAVAMVAKAIDAEMMIVVRIK